MIMELFTLFIKNDQSVSWTSQRLEVLYQHFELSVLLLCSIPEYLCLAQCFFFLNKSLAQCLWLDNLLWLRILFLEILLWSGGYVAISIVELHFTGFIIFDLVAEGLCIMQQIDFRHLRCFFPWKSGSTWLIFSGSFFFWFASEIVIRVKLLTLNFVLETDATVSQRLWRAQYTLFFQDVDLLVSLQASKLSNWNIFSQAYSLFYMNQLYIFPLFDTSELDCILSKSSMLKQG